MLCTVVFGGIASVFIVEGAPLGNAIEAHMPVHGPAFLVVWNIVRWVVTVILVSLLFSCYYYFGPNREMPKWQWVSPGGVSRHDHLPGRLAGVLFLRGDVRAAASYSKTYGALAGAVVLLMFWLYLAAPRSCSAGRSTPRPSVRPPCRPATPGHGKVPGRWSRVRRPRAPTAPRADAGPVRARGAAVPEAPRRACVTPRPGPSACPSPSTRGRRASAGWRPPARR